MPKKRYSTEQIIKMPREAEVGLSQGFKTGEVCVHDPSEAPRSRCDELLTRASDACLGLGAPGLRHIPVESYQEIPVVLVGLRDGIVDYPRFNGHLSRRSTTAPGGVNEVFSSADLVLALYFLAPS
jgi:hypothetical protein